VTLFASGSVSSATLIPVWPRALRWPGSIREMQVCRTFARNHLLCSVL
jgi:hypothetical protein